MEEQMRNDEMEIDLIELFHVLLNKFPEKISRKNFHYHT